MDRLAPAPPPNVPANRPDRAAVLSGFAVLALRSVDDDAGAHAALSILRQSGLTWCDLLDPGRMTSYRALFDHYGHPSDEADTRPGRCPAEPPDGRVQGGWLAGWHRACGVMVFQRLHRVRPMVLARMAVLANLPNPTPCDMTLAQSIMWSTWDAPAPVEGA